MSRMLLDFNLLINQLFIFANILLRIDMKDRYIQILYFVADLASDTHNLIPLMKVYFKIAKHLSGQKEYEKSIRILKKMLKVSWIQNDNKMEITAYEMLAL